MKKLPPQKYLKECFLYLPITGEVNWRFRPKKHFVDSWEWKRWNTRHGGARAFQTRDHKGYLAGFLDGERWIAHRIIWKYQTGEDPVAQIDHKNRRKADNKWKNLRQATPSQNVSNRTLQKNNKTGVTGVFWHKRSKKWFAKVANNHLGMFNSKQAAAKARTQSFATSYGEFAP